jgi:hypothetical protein
MSRLFIALLGAVLVVSAGCKHDDNDNDMHHGKDAKMMSADVCSHCPGVQHGTADGKCEKCGMDVSQNMKNASSAKMMSADACSHCPGVQKATADGKCPVCGADVSSKK